MIDEENEGLQNFVTGQVIGVKSVDLGNYFTDDKGKKFLFTSLENAEKYWQLVNVPIVIRARGQE